MSGGTLNPDNYLSYLSPADAFQFEVARNLYLAVLGATIWDILVYLPEDFKILRMRKGMSAVNVCFVTSRIFALCYVLLSTLTKTTPVHNCSLISISTGCCCILSIYSSTFLFLRRVQAVYSGNRWISIFFSVLWLLDGGLEVTVPVGARTARLPGTNYCIDSPPRHYVFAGGLLPVVFDTCVFLAISYKIGTSHNTQDVRLSWSTLISGRSLPRLSRAILHGGQQYYLVTTGVYLVLAILIVLPSIPTIYKDMLAFPSVALSASMACRVYRNIMLFDFGAETTRLPVSDLCFARETRSHKHAENTSFSLLSVPTRFQTRLGRNISSPATSGRTIAGEMEEHVELQIPERSATHEGRPKVDR